MKKHIFSIVIMLSFSILFWLTPAYYSGSEGFEKAILQTRDSFFKIRQITTTPPEAIKDIVLVTIDEESCQKLNARWPWSRTVLARVVDQLTARKARLVGLNLSFTGLEDGRDQSTQNLAKAMREQRNVIVGETFDAANRVVKPSTLIAQAAARIGYLDKIVDADFVIRRSYLVAPYTLQGIGGIPIAPGDSAGLFESSFPLQLAAAYSGPKDQNNPSYDPELGLVSVGSAPRRGIFVMADGEYVINFLAPESDFQKISAWKVAEGRISGADVRNKAVLVGLTSSIFSDTHPTPVGILSGISIHANELLSILSGRMLRFVPDSVTNTVAWLAGLCILVLFLVRRFWLGLVGGAVALLGLFIAAQILFTRDLVMEPFLLLAGPFLATVTGLVGNSLKLLLENKGLEKKVIRDKLTGLYKYEYLRECLEEEWKRCHQAKLPVSIVMMDLDRFKQINDTLGHETGNEMIRRAALVIQQSARRYDVVSRYGGDEFVILLWHSNLAEAKAYRERLRKMYQTMADGLEPALKDSSISIGVASYDPFLNPHYPPDAQRLVEDADKDLYLDKESRRQKPT